MAKEYTIYCDESVAKGKYFSDFYGGCIVETKHIKPITTALKELQDVYEFSTELKWTKINKHNLEKYKAIMQAFFGFLHEGKVKVRIMFRQNAYEPVGLSSEQKEQGYFLLYYQFIKHAFGLRYCNEIKEPIYLRTYFDKLPENRDSCELFKNHIYAIQSLPEFENANIQIRRRDIADVDSKDHLLLQCVDIVLGAMAFRLNDLHMQIPEGQKRRGNRTIAKEKLYKFILSLVKKEKPNFNIGISTGQENGLKDRWDMGYAHWKFVPKNYKLKEERFKQ